MEWTGMERSEENWSRMVWSGVARSAVEESNEVE